MKNVAVADPRNQINWRRGANGRIERVEVVDGEERVIPVQTTVAIEKREGKPAALIIGWEPR